MPEGQLCTIELIAEGHAERCTGEACVFWHGDCVLEEVESDLHARPHVAAVLLTLRREVGAGAEVPVEFARERLRRALSESVDEVGPAGGATELV